MKQATDRLYADIRSLFAYKRREFAYTCEDGFGAIQTPDFNLHVHIDQCPGNAKNYQLSTEITALHTAEIARDQRFHSCFTHHCESLIVDFPTAIDIDAKIDAIEAIPAIADALDYQPDGSAFELKLVDLDLHIHVTPEQMRFQLLTLRNLGKLLEHSQQAFEILTAAGLGARLVQ